MLTFLPILTFTVECFQDYLVQIGSRKDLNWTWIGQSGGSKNPNRVHGGSMKGPQGSKGGLKNKANIIKKYP